jgi:uncharacterized membrane protein YoaK (UPF0700 family)
MKLAAQIGAILLVALALTASPGGDSTLNVALTILQLVFFVAIAAMGYRLFRQFRPELDTLEDRVRLVLYTSVGAAFLTFCATNRMFDSGGLGALAWIALLALCSYGVYWVWLQYRGDRSY